MGRSHNDWLAEKQEWGATQELNFVCNPVSLYNKYGIGEHCLVVRFASLQPGVAQGLRQTQHRNVFDFEQL